MCRQLLIMSITNTSYTTTQQNDILNIGGNMPQDKGYSASRTSTTPRDINKQKVQGFFMKKNGSVGTKIIEVPMVSVTRTRK